MMKLLQLVALMFHRPHFFHQVEEWWRCSQRKAKSESRIQREKAIVNAYWLVTGQRDDVTH